jgi:hypothetical protein
MTKEANLARWRAMNCPAPILPHFEPIQYRAQGSRYGACGIRIDGNPQFIDAVLSRLTDILEAENGRTRLELSRSQVKPVMGKDFLLKDDGAECCYIRLHIRGPRARR